MVLFCEPGDLRGDALANFQMLGAAGVVVERAIPTAAALSTIVVDAVLGTGLTGAARGPALAAIDAINSGFPLARVVAVDVPSGMTSDGGARSASHGRPSATDCAESGLT